MSAITLYINYYTIDEAIKILGINHSQLLRYGIDGKLAICAFFKEHRTFTGIYDGELPEDKNIGYILDCQLNKLFKTQTDTTIEILYKYCHWSIHPSSRPIELIYPFSHNDQLEVYASKHDLITEYFRNFKKESNKLILDKDYIYETNEEGVKLTIKCPIQSSEYIIVQRLMNIKKLKRTISDEPLKLRPEDLSKIWDGYQAGNNKKIKIEFLDDKYPKFKCIMLVDDPRYYKGINDLYITNEELKRFQKKILFKIRR